MKKILIIIIMSIFLIGCSNSTENSATNVIDDVIANNNYIVVDVRTNPEYESGHVIGAINIPYTQIDETIELDKEKDILVYCQSGGRSSIAKSLLEELGYIVYDLGSINNVDLPKE